jgi:hypothetical protein
MHHDDYMAHYALLAKQRKYRPVKPRQWDYPLTLPVMVAFGIAIAFIALFAVLGWF